ncbi:S8 family serine peptidase [Kitasatospora kifunensis]|uniref:Peptidase S53 domain-containing protein n=1 Tax=Kitasatospora kifunensis TaxID=58351 RepID=A0A7W7VZU9_KITKI|nr:S8 family serine peptidase [Kitasatospora kifunensis]MBB4928483.1 hypothetical protein [Kitasatospora kifunensis]
MLLGLVTVHSAAAQARSAGPTVNACPAPTASLAACFAVRRTDPAAVARQPGAATVPTGYGPADLRQAYALSSDSTATVAIVDAYDDPTAEQDLAVYRSQYGLAPCTAANGCFSKVNQSGASAPLPVPNAGWAGEISVDVDMVSAVCPHCHILLVEANSNGTGDLYAAEDQASANARFVSNSWGSLENPGELSADTHFEHPGVVITASTGDTGAGTLYPAASPQVTAVGGTTLQRSATPRGWTETAWSGAGSGCSGYEPRPSRQLSVATGCNGRAIADVSADADPSTGVAVYQTYGAGGWQVYGGTSVASPIVAGVYALGGVPGGADLPAAYPYTYPSALNDVTSGSNGSCGAPLCTAGPGWDGPTGLGTPAGTTAFSATHLWQFGVANGAWYADNVAAAPGGSAVGTPSVDSGATWVRGSDDHLREFVQQNGQWTVTDVTAATGVPVAGDPAAQGGGVYVRDTNDHLRQFYPSNGSWTAFDVTAASGVPIVGDLSLQSGGGGYAEDTNGHLRQFDVSNGVWVAFDVTAATGATIAGNPVTAAGVVYARDANNHLRQFFVSNGAWVTFDVSAATNALVVGDPALAGGVAYARSPSGDLLQFYVANGAWVVFDVTTATGVPIAGNPATVNGAEYARTASGHLVQFFVTGGKWVSFDVTAATGTPVSGDPLATGSAIWTT